MKNMQNMDWLLALHAQLNNSEAFWEVPFENPKSVAESFYKLGINKETNEPEMQPIFDSKDSLTVESIAEKLKELAKSGNLFVNRNSKTANKSEVYQIASDIETDEPKIVPFPKNVQEIEALPIEAKGIWASICNFFDQILSLFSDDAKKRLKEKQAANNLKEMEKNIVNDTSKNYTKIWDKIFKANEEVAKEHELDTAREFQKSILSGIKLIDAYKEGKTSPEKSIDKINKALTQFMQNKQFQNNFDDFLSRLDENMRGKVVEQYTEKVVNSQEKTAMAAESAERWLKKTNELNNIDAKKEELHHLNTFENSADDFFLATALLGSEKISKFTNEYTDIANFSALNAFFEVRDEASMNHTEKENQEYFEKMKQHGIALSPESLRNQKVNAGPSPDQSMASFFSKENNENTLRDQDALKNKTTPNADRYADALSEFVENKNPAPLSEAISDDLAKLSERIMVAKIEGSDEKLLYGRMLKLFDAVKKIGKDTDLAGKIEEKWQQKDSNYSTVKAGLFLMDARQKGQIAQEKLLDSNSVTLTKETTTALLKDVFAGLMASAMLGATIDKSSQDNKRRINLFTNMANHPEQMDAFNDIKNKLSETPSFKRLANSDHLTIAKNIAKGPEALDTIYNLCFSEAHPSDTADKEQYTEKVVNSQEKTAMAAESAERWLKNTNELNNIDAKKEAFYEEIRENDREDYSLYMALLGSKKIYKFADSNSEYKDIANFSAMNSFFEIRDKAFHERILTDEYREELYSHMKKQYGVLSDSQINSIMTDESRNTAPSPDESMTSFFSKNPLEGNGWLEFRKETTPNADRYADALSEFVENKNPEPLSEAISDDLAQLSERIALAKADGPDERLLYGKMIKLFDAVEKIGKDTDLAGKIEEKWQQKDNNYSAIKTGLYLMDARQKGQIAQQKLLDSNPATLTKETKTALLKDILSGTMADKMLNNANNNFILNPKKRLGLFKLIARNSEQLDRFDDIKNKLPETPSFKRLANSDYLTIAKNIAKGPEALDTICNLCINEAQQTKTTDKSKSAAPVQNQKEVQKTQTKSVVLP